MLISSSSNDNELDVEMKEKWSKQGWQHRMQDIKLIRHEMFTVQTRVFMCQMLLLLLHWLHPITFTAASNLLQSLNLSLVSFYQATIDFNFMVCICHFSDYRICTKEVRILLQILGLNQLEFLPIIFMWMPMILSEMVNEWIVCRNLEF